MSAFPSQLSEILLNLGALSGAGETTGRGHASHRGALGEQALSRQGQISAGVDKCCGATEGGA